MDTLRASLCRSGALLFGVVQECLDPARPVTQALGPWGAFGDHAVGCHDCYPHVANAGGLKSIWRTLRPYDRQAVEPYADPDE